jgi:DNA-binding transcriptional MocR family regulator
VRADLVLAVHALDDVDKIERALLFALAIRTNKDTGQCNPSLDTLVRDTGWGRSTLSPAIRRLAKRGLIVVRRGRSSMQFELQIPRSPSPGYLGDGCQISSGRTVKIQEADRQDPGAGPKVKKRSEEGNVNGSERGLHRSPRRRPAAAWDADRQLGPKVDDLLTASPELFIREGGAVLIDLLASSIWQRDGYSGPFPETFLEAVRKCAAARLDRQQRRRPA